MSHLNDTAIATHAAVETTNTSAAKDSVKDAGRVRVGAGMLRFDQPAATPRANTAGAGTKDSGRVRLGAGMLRF